MIYSNGRAVNNNWTTCSCGDPEGFGGPDSLSLWKNHSYYIQIVKLPVLKIGFRYPLSKKGIP